MKFINNIKTVYLLCSIYVDAFNMREYSLKFLHKVSNSITIKLSSFIVLMYFIQVVVAPELFNIHIMSEEYQQLFFYHSNNPEIIQLFASVFTHSSIGHLVNNLFTLILFGLCAEQILTDKEYILLFVGSSIIASLFTHGMFIMFSSTEVIMVGSSVGVASLIGVTILRIDELPEMVNDITYLYGILFVLSSVAGLDQFPLIKVNYIGHLVGFAIGFLYYKLYIDDNLI